MRRPEPTGADLFERLRLLDEATRSMNGSLDFDRTLACVAEAAASILGGRAIVEALCGDDVRRAPETDVPPGRTSWRAPIAVDGGERLGTLTVYRDEENDGREPADDERELTSELARRAAVPIRNARLFAQARESARRAELAASQAEAASRLKDEFLATVSHELRTPLSSILGWANVLKSDPSLTTKGIEIIDRNARTQQRIVEDMLDASRIISGKLRVDTEPVDLAAVSREVVESARPGASGRGVELAFVSAESSCRLAGDGARLRQVISNLLSNAIKFTPEGGHVWVEVAQLGDRCVLRVIDTGLGIAPAFLPHVFERFSQGDPASSTTREQAGGLGLGLAIVRHLVDLHGGTTSVSSEGEGKGAAFTVTLPVKPFSAPVRKTRWSERPRTASAPAPVHTARLRGLRVLVVEDEEDSRGLIELLLEGEGAIVTATASANDALSALATFHADVVLSDVGMPGRDGYWLASELRRREPRLPTVALTAYATEDDVSRALQAGFDHHVAKPVDPEQLVAALVGLGGRTPTSDRTTSAA